MPFQKGNKLGGNKKQNHTIQAEAAKAALIKAYCDNIKPINEALIKKAVEGDIQAIKELHDQVYGKAPQSVDIKGEVELHIISIDE